MAAADYKSIQENLPLLLPYYTESNTFEKDAEIIGTFLASVFPVKMVALLRTIKQDVEFWTPEHKDLGAEIQWELKSKTDLLMEALESDDLIEEAVLSNMLSLKAEMKPLLLALKYDGKLYGALYVCRNGARWKDAEKETLHTFCHMLGITFVAKISAESEQLNSIAFNKILDGMKASLYITDVETDKILFMNQAMKRDFGLEKPEGDVCWKVLQCGMKGRCSFCPVNQLKKKELENTVIQWEEENMVTGKTYQNYDSLLRWIDGTIVHLQQSIDITDVKFANTDELTSLLTRRAGKQALQDTMQMIQNTKLHVTVCLYDINNLKEANDQYGHKEGDRRIQIIVAAVNSSLLQGEYSFRMGNDEFAVVFLNGQKRTQQRLELILKKLRELEEDQELSFCYGLVEVSRNCRFTAEEAIYLADERMYEQKRKFHILLNENRRKKGSDTVTASFEYAEDKLYDALVQSTDAYLYVCNMKTGVFRYPKAMVDEFDLPGEVIDNAAAVWGSKVHEEDRPAFLESNQEITDNRTNSHCVEYRAKNRKGEWVWVRCRGHLELDENGEASLFAGFITNLGNKNKIDTLTGLFNKIEFEELIRRLTERESNQSFAIMMLGIDDLKHVNDLYDRSFGDEVIRIVSQRIRTFLPEGATVYRLDGDEFGIIAMNTSLAVMQRFYRSLQLSYEKQQEHEGKKYYCTLSAGCSFYPQDAGNFLSLIKYSGYSLEYAKNHGKKQCVFFSNDILGYRTRTLEMVESLRESIENDFEGFSLRFQPLVEAGEGKLIGVEALARWQCEKFGQVSPVEFIPLLEQTGMIIPVGKWVFRTAVHTVKQWYPQKPELVVDINLSYLQIQGCDFIAFMQEVLEEEQLPSKNVVVELTESYFAREDVKIQTIFSKIRETGVRIAMDDFGTGYSALGILKQSPADIVKIDKAFIRDIKTSNFDATFIRFVVALCHDVGILVCLEGVETKEEYEIVSSMGLDMIQGYLFDRPLTVQEFYEKYLVS